MKKQTLKRIVLFVCLFVMTFVLTGVSASANLRGDIDGNGRITAADARIVLRIAAKLDIADDAMRRLADVNGSGGVTSADARLILRVSAAIDNFDGYEEMSTECPTADVEWTTKVPTAEAPTKIEDTIMDNTSKKYRIEDMLGADVNDYISRLSLKKNADGQKNKYSGDDISFIVRGRASLTPDIIDYVHTSRSDVSVLGIGTGMTIRQAELLLSGKTEYFIEDIDTQYSSMNFYIGEYYMVVLFSNDISYIMFGGKQDMIDYSVDSLIDRSAEDVFSGDVDNFTVTENEDGTKNYSFEGMTAVVCEKFGQLTVDSLVLEGESDFLFLMTYAGSPAEQILQHAEGFGYTVADDGNGNFTVEGKEINGTVSTSDGIVTRIELQSTVRPYKPGQNTDLSFLMGDHVTEAAAVTGEEPVAAEFDNNTWMFESFYLTTEGCMSPTPYEVCGVTVFSPGYGFAGIDFGMPVDELTRFLDEKGVVYSYDADACLLQIAKGVYGDYSFRITTYNGCVDWIEVSTEIYEGVYALHMMLMTEIDLDSEPYAGLEKTEENGKIKLAHDCVEFYLTEVDGKTMLTGVVLTETCDFNIIGLFVGDDITLIEAELIGCGFTDFTERDGCFRTSNEAFEIVVYESMGYATRIELRACE